MTILTTSGNQWPLLQDLQETKHKSGLFSCTATYIRPAGDTSLPTQIETFIGPVDVWPEPTVNKDTSGFEVITATGYGVWDGGIEEIVYGYNLHTFGAEVTIFQRCTTPDVWELVDGTYVLQRGCQDVACGMIKSSSKTKASGAQVILETCSIKKIGDTLPPPPTLKAFDTSMNEITALTPALVGLPTWQEGAGYEGTFSKTDAFTTHIASLRKNVFGSVIETEVVYELSAPPVVTFGSWIEPEVDASICDPGPQPADPA